MMDAMPNKNWKNRQVKSPPKKERKKEKHPVAYSILLLLPFGAGMRLNLGVKVTVVVTTCFTVTWDPLASPSASSSDGDREVIEAGDSVDGEELAEAGDVGIRNRLAADCGRG